MLKINENEKYYAVQQFLYKEQFKYLWKLLTDNNIDDYTFRIGIRTKYNTMHCWERFDTQPSVETARRIYEFFHKRGIKCDIKLLRFNPVNVKRQLRFYDIETGNKTINVD